MTTNRGGGLIGSFWKKPLFIVAVTALSLSWFAYFAERLASAQSLQPEFCSGAPCGGKNPKIQNLKILQQAGARPRWSPDGQSLVFDRINTDAYYDVYILDVNSGALRSLTDGNPGIPQKNNGNAIFHPSGNYVIFLSEDPTHVQIPGLIGQSDPGIGIFSNFWATDLNGSRFWQLTSVPVPHSLLDTTPYQGVVNPNFSPDGSQFVYSNRYGPGGNNGWGVWRLMSAPFLTDPTPRLGPQTVLFQPTTGNYVTSMGFLDATHLLAPGNLEGQNEYGMDENVIDTKGLKYTDLTNTPNYWEEGACISPNKQWIVYMSNATSRDTLDFSKVWFTQPVEREYWLMKADGTSQERLTYINDASAPEYLGRRAIVAACDWSPDGRFIAGTLGVDYGTASTSLVSLKVMLMEFADPTPFAATDHPTLSAVGPAVNGASFTQGFTSGGWVSILGSSLASSTRIWTQSDFSGNNLPSSLDGVSVQINGKAAYVYYVSPTQVNVLAPDDTALGPVSVRLTNGLGTSQNVVASKRQYAPGFFLFTPQGGKYLVAQHADYSLVGNTSLYPGASTPAKPGEMLILYATGFGPTVTPAASAQILPQPVNLSSAVTVSIGGASAQVLYSGLISSGLVQLNVVVPNVPDGDEPVIARVGGAQTQASAYVTVQH